MVILPEGFALPPIRYLLGLTIAGAVVLLSMRDIPDPINAHDVLAFLPWMVVGATAHVLFVQGYLSTAIAPLAGTPTVYVTTAIGALGSWRGLRALVTVTRARQILLIGGGGISVVLIGWLFAQVNTTIWRPLIIIVGSTLAAVLITGTTWIIVRFKINAISETRPLGPVVLFGHALDGITTAVGVDVLGFGERSPLSALILEVGSSIPGVSAIGGGWQFILIKLIVISGVLWLFIEYIRSDRTQAELLLGLMTAVGVGPAIHNLLLFSVATAA
jgi:uncharacterized membrane protein